MRPYIFNRSRNMGIKGEFFIKHIYVLRARRDSPTLENAISLI